MLKIIHTADWHLGQNFYDYDRTYEHQCFIDWLLANLPKWQPDALLISGDIFDVSNPSAQAQRMFYRFLRDAHTSMPQMQMVITAGNHDSATRLEAPQALLEEMNTHIVGQINVGAGRSIDYSQVCIPLRNKAGEEAALCLAIPFLRLGDYPQTNSYTEGVATFYKEAYLHANARRKPGQAIIAMGHLHAMDAEISEDDRSERAIVGGVEFVPASAFNEGIAYTALGHIHKPQRVAKREHIRYSGSPIPMSFSERNYQHQFVMVEIVQEKATSIAPIHIPVTAPLQKISCASLSEALALLEALPHATDPLIAPYLEVQVQLESPVPSLKHDIMKAIEGKQARLAKITVSYKRAASHEKASAPSEEEKTLAKPLALFERHYTKKYGQDLPDYLRSNFVEAMREAGLDEG